MKNAMKSAVSRGVIISLCLIFVVPSAWSDSTGTTTGPVEHTRGALERSTSLLDAWSVVDEEHAIPWAYAFVQRHSPSFSTYRSARLVAELDGLIMQARILSRASLLAGLTEWQEHLSHPRQARQPGRFDPAWLMANPRHIPTLDELSALGWCKPRDWVEVWSASGVERITWEPDMTTHTLLKSLPEHAHRHAQHLHVITTLGEIYPVGIAAWNYDQSPIAPGSRVTIELPLDSLGARWLDTALPRFLSTRLPGDDCTRFSLTDTSTSKASPQR